MIKENNYIQLPPLRRDTDLKVVMALWEYVKISTLLNRKSVPTIQTLEKICEGFDITLAQFFAGDEEIPDLTADQKQLLYDWNAMDEHQKELVKAYIQGIIRK